MKISWTFLHSSISICIYFRCMFNFFCNRLNMLETITGDRLYALLTVKLSFIMLNEIKIKTLYLDLKKAFPPRVGQLVGPRGRGWGFKYKSMSAPVKTCILLTKQRVVWQRFCKCHYPNKKVCSEYIVFWSSIYVLK